MARIAVGGFQHETNTFSPQQATWDEFVRADAWPPLLRGPEMIAGVEGFNIPISGAVKRLAELGQALHRARDWDVEALDAGDHLGTAQQRRPGIGAHELIPGRLLGREGIGLVLKAT